MHIYIYELYQIIRIALSSAGTSQHFTTTLDLGPDALRCFAERRAKEISDWLHKHEATARTEAVDRQGTTHIRCEHM